MKNLQIVSQVRNDDLIHELGRNGKATPHKNQVGTSEREMA
jgi:hypothetical protein